MKIIEWLVRIVYWLQAFFAPVFVLGLVAVLIYSKTGNRSLVFFLVGLGIITGVIVAEYIRRKYGLESFFGRIYGPNDMDEKFRRKTK